MADLSLSEIQAFDPTAKGSGRERRFCCPLCGDAKPRDAAHRSLGLNIESGAWNCHRCGEKGLLLEYRTERREPDQRRSPYKASRNAVSRAFALPDAPKPDPIPENAQEWREKAEGAVPVIGTPGETYLQGRGIPTATMDSAGVLFKADFYGRAAVLFLIREASGSPVAVEGRFLSPGTGPKAICKGPKSKGVFATPGALEAGSVALVEAPIDALTLAALGLPAIATMGAENLPKWLPRRLAFREVFLAQDADQAGDEAAERIAAELQAFGGRCSRLRPNQAKDWNELLQNCGDEAVRNALHNAREDDPLKVYAPVPPDLFADPDEYDPFADE
jgi:phage/plasmid primase-like uncharacterized protein